MPIKACMKVTQTITWINGCIILQTVPPVLWLQICCYLIWTRRKNTDSYTHARTHPRTHNWFLPVYSGKQTVRDDFLIFSSNRSFLFKNKMIEVSVNHLLLQMESNSFRLSCIRFWKHTNNHTPIIRSTIQLNHHSNNDIFGCFFSISPSLDNFSIEYAFPTNQWLPCSAEFHFTYFKFH